MTTGFWKKKKVYISRKSAKTVLLTQSTKDDRTQKSWFFSSLNRIHRLSETNLISSVLDLPYKYCINIVCENW